MLEIQKNTLIKAMKMLNSIDVEYAILANGEKYGTLELAVKKPASSQMSFSDKYGRSVVLNYVKPYVTDLKVGEVVCIPAGDYVLDAVASTASTYAHEKFGVGGYTGHKNKENNTYELLRLEV